MKDMGNEHCFRVLSRCQQCFSKKVQVWRCGAITENKRKNLIQIERL